MNKLIKVKALLKDEIRKKQDPIWILLFSFPNKKGHGKF